MTVISTTRVSEQSKVNCMDSKNLAICWWPTLLQVMIVISNFIIVIVVMFNTLLPMDSLVPHPKSDGDPVYPMATVINFLFTS